MVEEENLSDTFPLFLLVSLGFSEFLFALKSYPAYLYLSFWSFLWDGANPLPVFSILFLFIPLLLFKLSSRRLLDIRFWSFMIFSLALLASFLGNFATYIFVFSLLIGFFPFFLASVDPFVSKSLGSNSGLFYSLTLTAGFLLDITFRGMLPGIDARFITSFTLISFLILVFAVSQANDVFSMLEDDGENVQSETNPSNASPTLLDWLGFSLVLFFTLVFLSNPNTLLRWAFVDYPGEWYFLLSYVMVLLMSTVLLVMLSYANKDLNRSNMIIFLVLFASSFAGSVWLRSLLSSVLSVFAFVLLPVIFAMFTARIKWSIRDIALGFTVFNVVFIVASFLYTFTFVYPYLPGISIFRDALPQLFSLFLLLILVSLLVVVKKNVSVIIKPTLVSREEKYKALAFVLLLLVILAFTPMHYDGVNPSKQLSTKITVMSYNIHQGFSMENKIDLEHLAKTIQRENPDIVGLQETDTGRLTSALTDQLLWLSEKLDMYSAYAPALGQTYGVAALSKYPILEKKYFKLPSQLEQRVMIYIKIDVGYTKINFFALHLGLTKEERIKQLNEALAIINETRGPKILVGDFNAYPDSEEINIVKRVLNDTREVATTIIGPEATWPSNNPYERIDYIFVSNHFKVSKFKTITSQASDHLPVLAELELKIKSKIQGSLYANDAGEPKGGFEWAGEYNFTMYMITNTSGYIFIIQTIGLGDPLLIHTYVFENLTITSEKFTFMIKQVNGEKWYNITLKYYQNDDIWGIYNEHYIGRYIDPEIFPGFQPNYYVEIRIPRSNTVN